MYVAMLLFWFYFVMLEVECLKVEKQEACRTTNATAALFAAVKNGSRSNVEILLQCQVDVNARDTGGLISGQTALMKAAWKGYRDIANILIMNSASVDIVDDDGRTPLMYAAWNGHKDMVNLLLSHKSENINAANRYGGTALMYASQFGHTHIVQLLLSNNATVDTVDKFGGDTALTLAAEKGHLDIVKLLVTNNATVDIPNSRTTALISAARKNHADVIEFLLSINASVNAVNYKGRTALMFAAWHGNAYIVKLLISFNAMIDATDDDGETALMSAINFNGHINVVKILVSNDAALDIEDMYGNTALISAAERNHIHVVKFLLSKNASVDSGSRKTALTSAAEGGYTDILDCLISHNANVDKVTSKGLSALMMSAKAGKLEAGRFLLSKGANLDARDNTGNTALMYAAKQNHADIVKLLIGKKANLSLKNNLDETALDMAYNKNVVLLLSKENSETSPFDTRQVLILIALTVIVTFIFLIPIFIYKEAIKACMFSNQHMRWIFPESEDYDGVDKPYDVFISYSHHDQEYVNQTLLPGLHESLELEFRYNCLTHEKDWIAGVPILQNIVRSIEQSRKTLIVLSPGFIESFWGIVEFRVAFMEAQKIVTIVRNPRELSIKDMDKELRMYIRTNTYLECENRWFWQRLRFALGVPRNQHNTKETTSENL